MNVLLKSTLHLMVALVLLNSASEARSPSRIGRLEESDYNNRDEPQDRIDYSNEYYDQIHHQRKNPNFRSSHREKNGREAMNFNLDTFNSSDSKETDNKGHRSHSKHHNSKGDHDHGGAMSSESQSTNLSSSEIPNFKSTNSSEEVEHKKKHHHSSEEAGEKKKHHHSSEEAGEKKKHEHSSEDAADKKHHHHSSEESDHKSHHSSGDSGPEMNFQITHGNETLLQMCLIDGMPQKCDKAGKPIGRWFHEEMKKVRKMGRRFKKIGWPFESS